MTEKEKVILPPKYYLDYFRYLMNFVSEKSHKLLGRVGKDFISNFNKLDEDAQCLTIRMANRKGEYFRMSKITYEEISSVGSAVDLLIVSDFASLEPPNDPLLFKLFTKSELIKIFPEKGFEKKRKEEILTQLFEESVLTDYQKINSFDTLIYFQKQEEIEFLKMLFFGHNHGMMTEFVIRDIGNIKLENLDNHQFTPWFSSHEEALAVFELSKLNRLIKDFINISLPESLIEAIAPINWNNLIDYPNARKSADRIMLRLGEYFEKTGFYEEALSYYALAKKHPCRERQIRIYQKLGKTDEALDLAKYIYEEPYNASEKIFAKDFISKTGKRNLRSTTSRIKISDEITVAKGGNKRVEDKSLAHFSNLGFEGIHAENQLWRSLFGLLYWDELFDSEYATFHHPLQRAPSDLYSTAFYESRKSQLINKLKTLKTKKQLIKLIKVTYDKKQGINNPLVWWNESLLFAIETCIARLPLTGLKKVLLEISKNIKDNSTGFPDLFIWNEKSYQFYEVKSQNDHLSAQQLFWLDFFAECKIKSEILRVNYN